MRHPDGHGEPAAGQGPVVFVLFGATGDLARRMVLPAFYRLAREGLLPDQWLLVGNGRGDLSHEQFRAHVHDATSRTRRSRWTPSPTPTRCRRTPGCSTTCSSATARCSPARTGSPRSGTWPSRCCPGRPGSAPIRPDHGGPRRRANSSRPGGGCSASRPDGLDQADRHGRFTHACRQTQKGEP